MNFEPIAKMGVPLRWCLYADGETKEFSPSPDAPGGYTPFVQACSKFASGLCVEADSLSHQFSLGPRRFAQANLSIERAVLNATKVDLVRVFRCSVRLFERCRATAHILRWTSGVGSGARRLRVGPERDGNNSRVKVY